jgi:spermidine synthase
MIVRKGIATVYVNPYYFDDQLLSDRSGFIRSQLLPAAPLNRDFHPVAFFYQLQYWTTFFRTDYLFLSVAVLVIVLLVAFSLNAVSQGLFAAGFTASSLEILSILAFQVIFGYIYSAIGILITLFMAGLFAGSWFRRKIYPAASVKLFMHIQLTLSCFCIGFPFVILAMNAPGIPDGIIKIVFALLIFSAAFLTGLEFSMASGIRNQDYSKVISENYSADLFGSALGAILTAIVLLPFLGLIYASIAIAFLNILSAGFLFLRRKKTVTL